MKLEFGYGGGHQYVDVPDTNLTEILRSNPIRHLHRGEAAVRYSLEHPVEAPRLRELVSARLSSLASQGRKDPRFVIVTSDISRPLPSYEVLPAVLDEMYAGGCRPEYITVVIARGSHRESTEEEKRRLVGDICYQEVRVIDSSYEGCIHLGTTSRGTPADFDRTVAEADFRICLGNIEFHYFAGYSGGCKAVMPGVSTPEAISANHRMMLLPEARTGRLEGNPVREDLEEAASMLGVDFIVNVVLDEHKHIVYSSAGDIVAAHRKGCEYLDRMYRVRASAPADIVLVSQGGSPKDATLYQAQKALDNAGHIVREGGTVILIAACNEGLGNAVFEDFLVSAASPQAVLDRLSEGFVLGGHKAAAVMQVCMKAEVILVSGLDAGFVESIFLSPAASAQEAFDKAMQKHGPEARVTAMPFGGAVFPSL